ncbi:uncharacterized protein GVI51_L01441 [Nakaseomyces glabratus]|uniref:Biogenesis of lysosome-related organelles complex 1 subunit BLI1 n=1 Tax=Candida glabrata (strain ATCC 2001 / BCRC 20586 / JCM 3761 / NBRC 0622 / NRRL Y-65 / CBS 138) TaxID=284593 RepID=BLI1_CANGA|nr:uncharacterized protein CAGL0L01683g [Nakaseomyces glabratus]Q6FLQ1.1 RecName: Full=Biogenesis of lysosome-related organelles complex 1 subunit BLI1; Short=BLOC-1 subunit BLI1; AltName: Full=BLOC-1 interactor 1 [Nakaseomyces glabratus CBS 138]KAH7580772.1 BLOC-1 interactor 1 [Nakaseomyces glabratus]KAH7581332.1 BLOC-1 interactor 1 [Nakaseomyces glabratus]KAH7583492.1 BLOC-1 interactor 1 [Nakaseomyces glabratus]KAH7594894.1 BLOC-1 interactor 1 [Nakaseomyces glabratus]KAH7595321.1 BLOC-1 int|eukprot:XP_448843.1 uncharacterized protein CAGL0L01683g [[Candida] glabrata]
MIKQDVQKCVDALQDFVDKEIGESVNLFSCKSRANNELLLNIDEKFQLKDKDELHQLGEQKIENQNKLQEIRNKVEYYEKLLTELEEAQKELEVRYKLVSKSK